MQKKIAAAISGNPETERLSCSSVKIYMRKYSKYLITA
jgi:hypothetical protein